VVDQDITELISYISRFETEYQYIKLPAKRFIKMPQPSKTGTSTLTVKERDDTRIQPWKVFMDVTHTADSPIKIGNGVRLLGQRVNAHVG
jgi:hypothetical protein